MREAVENEEINVPYVNTIDDIADFFTKPITGEAFFRMRDEIMNCSARDSKTAGRAMVLKAKTKPLVSQPSRRNGPSRAWTLTRIGMSDGTYPTSDPRWCEVTASGVISRGRPSDIENAKIVACIRSARTQSPIVQQHLATGLACVALAKGHSPIVERGGVEQQCNTT